MKNINKKNLENFFSTKYDFYKELKNSNKNILIVDRERIDAIFKNSILGLAFSKKYKINAIIFSDQKKESLIINIYKKLGFKKFINGFSYQNLYKNIDIAFLSLYLGFIATINIYYKGFHWLINNFKVKNILIGDLIYDTNIRFQHRFKKPKIDVYFIKLLFTSIFRLILIRKYFKKYNIKKIIIGTETYSYNNGLSLRIATELNIDNYCYFRAGTHGIQIISYKKKYYKKGIGSLNKKDLKKLNNKFSSKKINRFYYLRKKLKSKNLYTFFDFIKANKNSKKAAKFLNLLKNKKNNKILFTSHAFADAAHFSGTNFVFNDYYDQLKQTIKFVSEYDKTNIWIFRSHPNSRFLNEYHIFVDLIRKYKTKNILLCPKNIPIKKLINICDVLVTGRGTTGLEFACEGKKVILAGGAPYSDFDIAHQAKTKKEYFNFIKNINNKINLNNNKKLLARKLMYIFENGLTVKKIMDQEYEKDFYISKYFKQIYQPSFSYNELFHTSYNFLKNGVKKSLFFKKVTEII